MMLLFFSRTCVLNVLLTSCADNVCRIWAETVKQRPTHAITATSTADQNKQRSQPDLAGDLEPPKELSPRDSSASLADMVDSSGDAKLSASVYRYVRVVFVVLGAFSRFKDMSLCTNDV